MGPFSCTHSEGMGKVSKITVARHAHLASTQGSIATASLRGRQMGMTGKRFSLHPLGTRTYPNHHLSPTAPPCPFAFAWHSSLELFWL